MKTSKTHLPYLFRESTFRRFEADISHVVSNWPEPTTINRPGMSLDSCAIFLRSTIRSLHRNRWPSVVNMEKFDQIFPDLEVSRKLNQIVVGPRHGSTESTYEAPTTQTLELIDPHLDILDATAKLLVAKVLQEVKVVSNYDDHVFQSLRSVFDIEWDRIDHKTVRLL